jgi:hypothetical protein
MDRRMFIHSATMSSLAAGSAHGFSLVRLVGSGGQTQSATPPEIGVSILPSVAGRIGDAFGGFSYEKDVMPMFTGQNDELIGLCRRLGSGVLRLGGNQVDRTTWDRSGIGRTPGKIASPDVDGLAVFARATGWKVLYGVNLAQSTPALAADEVAYATRSLGSDLLGIEIGNEPDGYVNAKYFPDTWGYADYLARWRGFASAILERSPSAVLTGPATAGNIRWFTSFATDAAKQVRLLTHHYYRGNGKLPTSDAELLVSYPDRNLMKQLSQIRNSAEAVKLPYRFAETNSYYNGGRANVRNSYASALWVIDDLFTLAANNCEGANFHSGGNWTGYTPIADLRGSVVGPRPEYYGIYFFTLAGKGELRACQYDAAGLNLSVYAVETPTGGVNVVAVNKEPRDVSIAPNVIGTGPGRSLGSVSVTMLTNTSLMATTGTTVGGRAIGVDGSLTVRESERHVVANGQLRCRLPPISATLLELS